MSKGNTPWVEEGPLRTRFRLDPSGSKNSVSLVKETNQADRNIIMANTAEMRKEIDGNKKAGDLGFGRLVGRIPIVDFIRIQKSHPDLFSPDPEVARRATVRFFNSTEGAPYRVRRA